MLLDHRSSYIAKPFTQRDKVTAFGRGGLLALFVFVLMAGVAKSARADVIETIVNTNDPTDTGTISFPGFTGTDATGVTLSFRGFTQSEITALSYSIDPGTDILLGLSLTAQVGDIPCGGGLTCENTTLSMSTNEASTVQLTCVPAQCSGFESDASISFSPVSATPEPSSMALFGSGLLGVWGAVRRRRAS